MLTSVEENSTTTNGSLRVDTGLMTQIRCRTAMKSSNELPEENICEKHERMRKGNIEELNWCMWLTLYNIFSSVVTLRIHIFMFEVSIEIVKVWTGNRLQTDV